MKSWREIRALVAVLLAACLACPPARALVTLNDSHDHIFVSTSFGVNHDSNVFASNGSPGDYVYSTGVTADYSRRAGWIGVNASVSMSASRFGKVKNQNFNNPNYSLELTKQSGRTTGSFTLSGARESRADASVNLRTDSWNYNAGLNYKYPIIERFTLSGGLVYSSHKYIDNAALANLSTYSTSFDLFYLLPRERDLIGGYRYRYDETSSHSAFTDHALTFGISGPIISGINGAVRFGYQTRVPHGTAKSQGQSGSWTGSSSVTYALTRKASLSGSLAKDFSVTATSASVDTTTASLDAQYAYNARWSLSANAGWSDSRFLGESGRIILSASPLLLGPNRHDTNVNWGASLGYTRSEHLKINFGYTWFENYSTTAFADFIRTNWNLNLSSRW